MVVDFTDLAAAAPQPLEFSASMVRLLTGAKRKQRRCETAERFVEACRQAEIEQRSMIVLAYHTVQRALDDLKGEFESDPQLTPEVRASYRDDARDWFTNGSRGDWSFSHCLDILGRKAEIYRQQALDLIAGRCTTQA